MCAGPLSSDIPDQCWLADEPAGKGCEAHPGITADGTDRAVWHAQYEAALCAYQRAGDGLNRLSAYLLDGNFPIQIFLQQLGGAGEIEFETLLHHPGTGRIGQRFEQDCRRVNQRRHVRYANDGPAFGQIDILRLPDDAIAGNHVTLAATSKSCRRQRAGLRAGVNSHAGLRRRNARQTRDGKQEK